MKRLNQAHRKYKFRDHRCNLSNWQSTRTSTTDYTARESHCDVDLEAGDEKPRLLLSLEEEICSGPGFSPAGDLLSCSSLSPE